MPNNDPYAKFRKKKLKSESPVRKEKEHAEQKPKKKRRSFSQKELATRTQGESGAWLLRALRGPKNEEEGYELTHGFHTYPGRFHPNLPRTILEHEHSMGSRKVFDPFMGGGTTLIEGMQLGFETYGNDLNPIANLVASERCQIRDSKQAKDVMDVFGQIETTIADSVTAKKKYVTRKNLNWLKAYYPPHLFVEMLLWIQEIEKLPESAIRNTLLAVFSSLVVKFSSKLSDSSEEQQQRNFPKGAVSKWMRSKIEELLRAQKDFTKKVPKGVKVPQIFTENIVDFEKMKEGSVDLIVTSPPYPGTYDYFKHHELRMKWFRMDEAPLKQSEIGTKRRHNARQWKQPFREILLKMRKIVRPSGYAYLVIGDWLDRDKPVSALEYLTKYAPSVGWELKGSASIQRAIYNKEQEELFGEAGKWEHLVCLKRPKVYVPES